MQSPSSKRTEENCLYVCLTRTRDSEAVLRWARRASSGQAVLPWPTLEGFFFVDYWHISVLAKFGSSVWLPTASTRPVFLSVPVHPSFAPELIPMCGNRPSDWMQVSQAQTLGSFELLLFLRTSSCNMDMVVVESAMSFESMKARVTALAVP